MKEIKKRKSIEYHHTVNYKGKEYIRVESLTPECFAWENEPDKLIDLHTISWRENDDFKSNSNSLPFCLITRFMNFFLFSLWIQLVNNVPKTANIKMKKDVPINGYFTGKSS